jgi:hypothetical protein
MKQALPFLLVYLLLFNCLACTPTSIEELDPTVTLSDPSLRTAIKAENPWLGLGNVGDTVVKVKPEKDVLPEKPAKKPDLSKLEKEKGKFRMVSVGGALSAGFRDGGLYRESQLTAFPALVARQMGVPFVQPLFSEAEGNGTGYKTVAGTGSLVTYKMVANNLGVIQRNGETAYSDFIDKDKVDIDQMAFPEISKGLKYYRDILNVNSHKYLDRVIKSETKNKYQNPWEWIDAQNADIFMFELGLDDLVRSVQNGGGGINNIAGIYVATSPNFLLMRSVSKKSKGIVLNVPDALLLPFFSQITPQKIDKLGVKLMIQVSSSSERYRAYDPKIDRLMPTPTVIKLFNGELKGEVNLQDSDVVSVVGGDDEVTNLTPESYNKWEVDLIAKELNWPVVDINSIYKRIQAGGYVTDDGVAVSAAWPRGGNFFSADGIYPTAFGQAVIANEVIKTLNRHYGLDISLIQTRFFINQ